MTSEEKQLSDEKYVLLKNTISKIHNMINTDVRTMYFEFNGTKYYEFEIEFVSDYITFLNTTISFSTSDHSSITLKYYEKYSPSMGNCFKSYIMRNIHMELYI